MEKQGFLGPIIMSDNSLYIVIVDGDGYIKQITIAKTMIYHKSFNVLGVAWFNNYVSYQDWLQNSNKTHVQ